LIVVRAAVAYTKLAMVIVNARVLTHRGIGEMDSGVKRSGSSAHPAMVVPPARRFSGLVSVLRSSERGFTDERVPFCEDVASRIRAL